MFAYVCSPSTKGRWQETVDSRQVWATQKKRTSIANKINKLKCIFQENFGFEKFIIYFCY